MHKRKNTCSLKPDPTIPIPSAIKLHQTYHRLLVSAAVATSLFACFSSSFLSRSSKTAGITSTEGLNMSAAADPAAIRDTFYISHGSPTLSIDETLLVRHFLQGWKDKVLPATRPKAILVISGYWEVDVLFVNAVQGPLDAIHDFYGFPKPMYQIKYPASGAPELANKVKELLMQSGFDRVHVDKKQGLDHGAWVPLMLMYPEADIPM